MAINFPTNPEIGDLYEYNTRTWTWNGVTWDCINIGVPQTGDEVYVIGSILDTPVADEILHIFIPNRNIYFPADFEGSFSEALVETSQNYTITIKKDNILIGKILFAAGSKDAFFETVNHQSISINRGEIITLHSDILFEEQLSGVAWNLKGIIT